MAVNTDRFAQALQAADPSAAFALLAASTEVPVRELPRVKPAQLAPCLQDAAARRVLVAGLMSRHANVRKWVKRQAPRLDEACAVELRNLLLVSWQPFLPAGPEALAGSWDGVASPIGARIEADELARAVQKRGDHYSPAMRYVNEVLLVAFEVLGRIGPRQMLEVFEFLEAKTRSPLDRQDPASEQHTGGLGQLAAVTILAARKGMAKATKDSAAVVEAVDAWVDGSALGERDPALASWLDAALTDADRRTRTRRLRWASARLLADLPGDDRTRLYHRSAEACRDADKETRRWWQGQLDKLRAALPGEIRDPAADRVQVERQLEHAERHLAGADLEAFPGLANVLERQVRELRAKLDPTPMTVEGDGPRLAAVMEQLAELADDLGLVALQTRLEREAGTGCLVEDDAVERRASAGFAPALEGLAELVRKRAPGGAFGEARLGEADLEGFSHAGLLLEAIQEGARLLDEPADDDRDDPWPERAHGFRTMRVTRALRQGLALLPRRLWPVFFSWHGARAARIDASWCYFCDEEVGRLLLDRPVTAPEVVAPWVRSSTLPRSCSVRRVLLAGALGAGGASRATALELVRELPLPEREVRYEENSMQPAWEAAAWQAWQTGDTEVLATMLGALELPYYRTRGKGSEAIVPPTEEIDWFDTRQRHRRLRPASGGTPLAHVVVRIAAEHPELLTGIARSALRAADHSWLAQRCIAVLARQDAFLFPADDLLHALESTSAPVVRGALDALARTPASAGPELDRTISSLDRLTGAGSKGIVKATVKALTALSKSFPARAEELAELIAEA